MSNDPTIVLEKLLEATASCSEPQAVSGSGV